MPSMEDLLPEVLPVMNGINTLAEALNNRLQSLPGKIHFKINTIWHLIIFL